MNQMIAPPSALNYVHPQYAAAAGQSRGIAPLTQLAAAAAATNSGNRNRLLGANSAIGGNPFNFAAANASNALAGLYGSTGYPAAAAGSLLGLQGRGQGAVPLIPDLPVPRQRRVQPRGGHLEVAGVVVGSWGANYGHNGNLTNALTAGGRNVRVPMTGTFGNQNIPVLYTNIT